MNIYKCGTQVEIFSGSYPTRGVITGQQIFDTHVIYEVSYKSSTNGNSITYMEENGFKVIDNSKPIQTIK